MTKEVHRGQVASLSCAARLVRTAEWRRRTGGGHSGRAEGDRWVEVETG